MESKADFGIDLPRVIPVESAESLAVVEFDPTVRDIHRVERGGESLSEVLPDRKVESCVLREVVAGIRLSGKRIAEARAVVDVRGGVGMPGQGYIAANIESVALVVIQRKEG